MNLKFLLCSIWVFGSILIASFLIWRYEAIYEPLNHEDLENVSRQQGGTCFLQSAAFWGYIFQILFQIAAGATMLTDSVYWLVTVPFFTINEYPMNFVSTCSFFHDLTGTGSASPHLENGRRRKRRWLLTTMSTCCSFLQLKEVGRFIKISIVEAR
ncbi:hypothetical protein Hanom_Chr06g00485091 [Helianthus anomalus]